MIYAQPKLLITDDDRSVRETLGRVFGRYGMDTQLATDGVETLRIAKEQEIHALLIDLHMPQISGLETIRRLREQQGELPCILISGAVTDEVQSRAEEVGAFSVLPKPINFSTLLETVRTALHQAYGWQPASN